MLPHYSFTALKTKRIIFEEAFSARDAACLEQLKELSAQRRLIDESVNDTSRITEATAREMAGGLTCRIEQDIQKLEHYLPLLQNFIIQADSVSGSPYTTRWILDLRIRWTSVLGSSPTLNMKGPKYFQINSLKYELGMALFLYASTLREKAFEDHTGDIAGLKISASLLQKSAGIFNYLTTEVVPSIMAKEKPPEVTTNVSTAMSLLCLAEAQAVAIKMAEKKKMSASSLAKLHYGVTQLLDEANGLLSLGSGDISGKPMDFIQSCRKLHELRSCRHLAESYRDRELPQVGVAIGLLNRALNNCKNYTPRNQSWRDVLKNEVTETSELLKKCNKDNEIVWREKIPLDFELPALEGTKIVNATPYEPEKWERHLAFK